MQRLLLLFFFFLSLTGFSQELAFFDDIAIIKDLEKRMGELADKSQLTHVTTLKETLHKERTISISQTLLPPPHPPLSLPKLYERAKHSVVVISSVYQCGKCSKWHIGSCATAWMLTANGIGVTNYHVFEGRTKGGFAIRTIEGRILPVRSILASNKANDIAIFQVAGEGFTPLPLGKTPQQGDPIAIISHPDTRFYTLTSGIVSRYCKKRVQSKEPIIMMAVTAAFARGSSGGPILDATGSVVGMVASTESIYYPIKQKNKTQSPGPFQMVINNCVPVKYIQALIHIKNEKNSAK